MPRSASEGGGNTGLFRTVFARSPLNHTGKTGSLPRPQSFILTPTNDGPIISRTRSFSFRDGNRPSLSTSLFSSDLGPSSSANRLDGSSGRIVHHGQAHLTSTSWRKRTEYLVLTERFLFRFKNAKLAADIFPWILPANAQIHRKESPVSFHEHDISSGTEGSTDISSTNCLVIPLQEIISTQILSTDRNRLTMNIIKHVHRLRTTELTITVDHTSGQPHWVQSISSFSQTEQEANGDILSALYLSNIRDTIGEDSYKALNDAPNRLFLVHRHQSSSNREELLRESSAVTFLLIGDFQVHLIIMPKSSRTSSSRSLYESARFHLTSHGIINLLCVSSSAKDDTFELVFRKPLNPATSFELASVHSEKIILSLHKQLHCLLPNWRRNPYTFRVPTIISQKFGLVEPSLASESDNFRLCLEAHCKAFDVDPNRIRYQITPQADDGPAIHMIFDAETFFPPEYSTIEIITFLRSLRYNNYFGIISLAGVPLDKLAETYDRFGDDHIIIKPLMGPNLLITFEEMRHASLLFQEITALVMSSRKLRRFDLANTIYRTPNPTLEDQGEDAGSTVLESLYPLSINQNTNLDWILLNGIHLSRTDIDFVIGMVSKKDCHLRAIEVSGCHLDTFNLRMLLSELPVQYNTLEAINISSNPGRLSPNIAFSHAFTDCKAMRYLDLSHLQLTPEPVSLISYEILSSWRLEELRLSKTKINEETLDVLIEYLKHVSCAALKSLHLDHCQLTTHAMQKVCQAASSNIQRTKDLYIDLSGNLTETFDSIIEMIDQNQTPPFLSMRQLEFTIKEDLINFLEALCQNQSLRQLDISGIQIEFKLDEDLAEKIRLFLAKNQSLEDLDISGENSRLETSSFGSGFFEALRGLSENKSLKVLRIRHQKLGLQGMTALSDVLRENTTLQELHCEDNMIPISALILFNEALETNKTIVYISDMEDSKFASIGAIQSEMSSLNDFSESTRSKSHLGLKAKDLFKMTKIVKEKEKEKDLIENDVAEAREIIFHKWEIQQHMLSHFLARNQAIAAGIGVDEDDANSYTDENHENADVNADTDENRVDADYETDHVDVDVDADAHVDTDSHVTQLQSVNVNDEIINTEFPINVTKLPEIELSSSNLSENSFGEITKALNQVKV